MRSKVLIGLWASALACTPTGPDATPAPTSASEQAGTPYRDRGWVFDVHASGQLIRAEEDKLSPHHDGAPIYPLVPHIHARSWGMIHLVPWWPRFPLVPGETQVFLGGAITQSVTEVDGMLRVELVAKPRDGDYPYRRVSMEWERGRPYWTRVEEVERRSNEPPLVPFEFRGKVVTWDRSNPWPLPRDVELREPVHPSPP